MTHGRLISTVVAVAAFSAVIASQTPSGHAVFEQALAKERVEGNLPEAIRLYERVVTEFASDRALAAKALVQVGLCYEKLGRDNAIRAYERVVRDFADQADAVSQARARLAVLKRDATPPASRGRMTVRELPKLVSDSHILSSVSPDGSKAAVYDSTKGTNLAIVDLASGQSRLLTNFDWTSSFASGGPWSPDGRHIAYLQGPQQHGSTADYELRVTTLDGNARTIFRTAPESYVLPTDWLPDGSAILASIKRPDGTWAIGLIAIADGRFTQLRTLSWNSPSPRVSPDGRFVAFVERTSGLGDLHVLSVDGRQAFRITDHPADDREPIWSPDGRQLAFISNRFGADALWTVAMENGHARGEAAKLMDGMNGVRLVDWSDRGLICYQQMAQSWDIFTLPMDPGTTRSTGSARPLPYARSGWNLAPAWSPDGKSLAFVSGSLSDPNSRHLVIKPSSGAAREFRIPQSNYPILQAPHDLRWFGNGRGLGFPGSDVRGQPVVFRLSLSSGEWTTIPHQGGAWFRSIEWNDDGTAFYFMRSGSAERNGIFRRSVEGGREELLYALPTPDVLPVPAKALEISPDRHWLAFEQHDVGQSGSEETQLIVLHTTSGERRTVMSLTSPSNGERLKLSGWSPDGRLLVQHQPLGSESAKWLLVPLDGGATQPLSIDIPTSPSLLTSSYPNAKWSPDGSAIAFVKFGRSNARAFILENPLADLPASKTSATRR